MFWDKSCRENQNTSFVFSKYFTKPVPVAARSKASIFGRTPAEIVGSNPTGGNGWLSVVSVVCCQVEVSAMD
jgi:hypothetical protein